MIKLGYLRAMTGLSQKDFGERLCVKSGTIAKYEKQDAIPLPILKLIRYEYADYLEDDGLRVEVKYAAPYPSLEDYDKCLNDQANLIQEVRELKEFKNKVILLEREKKALRKHNEELQYKLQEHKIKY